MSKNKNISSLSSTSLSSSSRAQEVVTGADRYVGASVTRQLIIVKVKLRQLAKRAEFAWNNPCCSLFPRLEKH
jgi:hypothetical protein